MDVNFNLMSQKEKARAYFSAVNDYDEKKIKAMLDENYIQHNPFVPTGRAAFLSLIPHLKKGRTKIKNLSMFEDGPYIIMHHIWSNAAPLGHDTMVAFHIIRFNSLGLIAEHWSVMMKDSAVHQAKNLHYQKQHKTLGDGNFILSIAEGSYLGVPSAIYDLFRFKKGKTAKHWSIVQNIPNKNLANQNTMFGF